MEFTVFAGSVPANYDKYLGPFLFEPYAVDLVNRLSNRKFKNVLELACGTGRVTKHLLNVVSDDGQLIASDLNPDMITIAKERIEDTKVKWQVVDAQELPFGDNMFDAIVCQFGVMFFPEKPKAFKEAHRVLQKNGVFLFNTWDSVETHPVSYLVHRVLSEEFGDVAPNFLEEGPFSFYDQKVIRQLLQDAGFRNISLELVPIKSNYETAEGVVKGFVDGSPLAMFLTKQDPVIQQRVREKLQEAFINRFGMKSNVVPMQAIVCKCEK